jgi:hypothetical protein
MKKGSDQNESQILDDKTVNNSSAENSNHKYSLLEIPAELAFIYSQLDGKILKIFFNKLLLYIKNLWCMAKV